VKVRTDGNGYTQVREYERPLGELFSELAQDVRQLVQLQLALAKTEMSEKASQVGKDVGFMAAGGFVIYAGFLAIIAAAIIGLANLIPAWLSALVVGLIVALIGYALLRKGMNDLKGRNLAPSKTIETLKEDKEWVQEQVR
jgi:xanthine/uracil permease